MLDLSNPATPVSVGRLDSQALLAGSEINSVAVHGGLVAVAIQASPKTDKGRVALYRAADLSLVGSVEVGKWADLVLWEPEFFGVKPTMVLKGGQIASAVMGDANASIPTPEPTLMRDMFGAHGSAPTANSITFMSQASVDAGVPQALGLRKKVCAAHGVRTLTKADMALNDATPVITVDPETYEVTVDGERIGGEPAEVLALAQRYFLF